jgi:predicted lipoprotein with Yx(FWY)xxD motif
MRPLKRLLALALTMGAGAAAITAVAVAPAVAGSTAGAPTIKLTSFAGKGKILTVGGFVVYRFSHDGNGHKNTCLAIPGCKQAWPALTTSGKPKAGPGVNQSLLGTITIAGGKHQVTYAGHPIYRYAAGVKGDDSYVGFFAFNGYWYGVNAKGKVVQ